MFEKLERLDALLTRKNWQWVLRWPVPWHSIGRLLTKLAKLPAYAEAERAWRQVDVIFRRHNNEDFSMANVPAWRVVERLCDQAMLTHSSRVHTGYCYTTRLYRDIAPSTESCLYIPVGLSSSMAEVTHGDIDMLYHFPSEGADLTSWITPPIPGSQLFPEKPDDVGQFPSNQGSIY